MTTDEKIKDEKLQYDINRAATKISAGKKDKYKYLTGENILPTKQHRIIEAKFTHSSLGKKLYKKKRKKKKEERKKKSMAENKLKP